EPLNGVVGAMNVGHRVDQIELARGLRHGDAILFGASAAPWRRVPLTPTLKFGEGRRLAQPRGEREKKRVCFRADSERRRSSGGESAWEDRREEKARGSSCQTFGGARGLDSSREPQKQIARPVSGTARLNRRSVAKWQRLVNQKTLRATLRASHWRRAILLCR